MIAWQDPLAIVAMMVALLSAILGALLVGAATRRARQEAIENTMRAPEVELAGGAPDLFVRGDLEVTGNMSLPARVRIDGTLVVAEAISLDGHIEVFGDAILRDRARIAKPIIVHGALRMGCGSSVVAAQVGGDAFLDMGARVDGTLACSMLYLNEAAHSPPIVALASLTEASGTMP